MDDITIEVSEFVNNISVTAQPNDQTIDITVTETVETVLLDVSTTVDEVTVTATQNVIVENITVDYVNNENNIDINVTDATQDVTLNITPTLVEINILRSGGEVNILQFNSLADFPTTGSSDYFYLAKDTNKLYRWSGSAYVEISATGNPVWGQIIGTLSEQTDLQNALNLKAPINSPTFTGTVSGITKTMVGLGAVDNTSDLDKPISTATQTALNNKQPLDGDLTAIAALSGTAGFLKKNGANSWNLDNSTYLTGITSSDVTTALGFTPENAANKGVNNGYASLDGGGKVPSSQLPSYVDDVIEVSSFGTLPSTGETGKIYITLDTNKIYRWSGSVYVEVSPSTTVWGQITGTLSNQTDLQSALDAKQDDLNGTGFVKASGTTISYDNTTYYPASNPNGYTSNTGTVTSVALTVPSAFSVSGSPITSSGTLAVTATGNTTQYIAGDGSLVTFPTMSTAGTLIREVRNTTGATLTKGTVVYISGATGNKPTVSKALATGDSTSAQTFGLVQADIANNANGNVVCAGDITGIDTSAFTEGAQLYLSSTTAGTYTTTKQLAPNHLVYIGVVTRAHPTLGQIEVNIQNGYELYELHDVSITSVANNDGLFYEASSDLWKNKSIATVLGYTPANGADYMALSGDQSIAGNKTFTGFAYFDNTIFLKQTTSISFISGYNSIAASSSGIRMGITSGISALFNLTNLTTNRDYTLPNASGTIALTSDIPSTAGFVATTGNQSIAGEKTFTGNVKLDGDLYFKQENSFSPITGYSAITADSGGFFLFRDNTTSWAYLSLSSLTTSRNFTFPDATGTLALTSQLHNAVTIGTANGLSLSTQVLSLGLASTSATGALSSTDWNTFNGKQNALTNPVTGTGTTSYLPKFTGTSAIGNSILYDTGSVLLVGATTASNASSKLELVSTSTVGLKIISSGANGNNTFLSIESSKEWRFLTNRGDLIAGNQGDLIIRNNTDGINHIILNQGGSTTFVSSVTANEDIIAGNGSGSVSMAINRGASSNSNGLRFRTAGTNNWYIGSGATGTNTDLEIYNHNTATSNIRIAYSTGNVGIGTTAPLRLLDVRGAVNLGTSTPPSSSTSGAYADLHLRTFSGASSSPARITVVDYWIDYFATFTDGHRFRNWSSDGVARDLMTITGAGNVGIGTTSPMTFGGFTNLTIASSTTSNQAALFLVNSNTSIRGSFYTNGSSNVRIGTATSHDFLFDTADTERMRITSGGNVLIGATNDYSSRVTVEKGDSSQASPHFHLSNTVGYGGFHFLDGTAYYIGQNSNFRSLRMYSGGSTGTGVNLAAGATSWGTYSDERMKTDLVAIENATEKVSQLRSMIGRYKTDEQSKKRSFLIAQDVKEVLPEAISEDLQTGMLEIRYTEVIPLLVASIKELKAKIETLENK
jgi:hypothetical protein